MSKSSNGFFDFMGPITMGIAKPGKEPMTIDEMRQEIFRASMDSGLIYNALRSAEHSGMSGEDKYVLIAYHALRSLETLYRQNLFMLNCMPLNAEPASPPTAPDSPPPPQR